MRSRIEQRKETIKKVSYKIDSSSQIDKKQSRMLSEIFSPLLGCHQELLQDNLRRRRPFGHEGKLEVSDNLVDNFVIFDKGDHFHLSAALRTQQRVNFIDFFYHLSPASGRYKWSLIFNDWRVGRIYSSLAHLASVCV